MKKSGPGGEWTLTVPTPFVFLVRFIKAEVPDQQLENMAHFLSELGMMHYATLMYCPSMVAASAVFAARCTLNKTPLWSDTLKLYTGYTQEQLMDCAGLLVSFHSNVGNGKLKVLYRKYSDPLCFHQLNIFSRKRLLPLLALHIDHNKMLNEAAEKKTRVVEFL
ncbi:hypothetical protein HN51_009511 [Arachis hypogaea]